jgi:glycerol-3-phosphate acyltransferase PlsY
MLDVAIPNVWSLLTAVVVGYVLGALPLADRLSRRSGVDIFRTGTGLAGATNVMRTVGRVPAAVVLLGDMSKGIITIFVAQQLLGLEGAWIVVPAAAAVIGHWYSIFSGFKGGDGFVVLGGITLAAFPEYGIIGVAFASLVALGGQRMRYTSLLNIPAGYMVVIAIAMWRFPDDAETALAMGALAMIVFGHAVLGHARRRGRSVEEEDDLLSRPDVEQERP